MKKIVFLSLVLVFSLFAFSAVAQITGFSKTAYGADAAPSCPCHQKAESRGCCSKHGGVDKCDGKKGQLKCKDGTYAGKNCPCPKMY